MQKLFITATGTNIGKTHTTLRLIEELSKSGIKVGVCKPIETGVTDIPMDAKKLLTATQLYNSNFLPLLPKDITAYTLPLPAAPFCADTNSTIEIDKIIEKIDELSKLCDLLIIEGAGGLMVPITDSFMMIDLIKATDAKAILVTPSRLGSINDTLLSIEALSSREIDFDWCVNLYEDKDSFDIVTKPYYDSRFPEWMYLEEMVKYLIK
ncbi:Dethiobiotin synthetase [hydrothermal vent metagenome]|uniref:Dethiobiotin synthetase n=1 Tax=hydrothermal vent metagenome TaxID=652676 RepID=A0A1W1BTW9_9ZZZZ